MSADRSATVVLGAGASIPSGIPTYSNFAEKAKTFMDEKRFDLALDLWDFYYRPCNLEELMTALDYHDELGVALRLGRPKRRIIEKHLGSDWGRYVDFKELGTLVKEMVPRFLVKSGDLDSIKQYELLHSQISDMIEEGWDITVISMNWDTLFEIASDSEDLLFHSGTYTYTEENEVEIIKPHGSLGYEVCVDPDDQGCSVKHRLEISGDREKWYREGKVTTNPCSDCGSQREIVLFPPHLVKRLPDEWKKEEGVPSGVQVQGWYKDCWKNMYKSTTEADVVFSIGYSWPDSDYHVKLQLGQAIRLGDARTQFVGVTGPKRETDEWKMKHYAYRNRVMDLVPGDYSEINQRFVFRPQGINRFLDEHTLLERARKHSQPAD